MKGHHDLPGGLGLSPADAERLSGLRPYALHQLFLSGAVGSWHDRGRLRLDVRDVMGLVELGVADRGRGWRS